MDAALAVAAGGVEAVRAACPLRGDSGLMNLVTDLHRLHRGERPRHLARLLRQHLAARRGTLRCPRCGQPL